MKRYKIIVGGFIGLLPAGGVTWDYIQYPLGLKEMGHEVFYLEDTRLYPIYQHAGSDWNDCGFSVEHLQSVMRDFGMDDQWSYVDEVSGNYFGRSRSDLKAFCAKADIFINLSCSTWMRDEYHQIPVRILIDTDPMFTQIQYLTGDGFTSGNGALHSLVDAHNLHFTFGEQILQPCCRIPTCGINWQTTRQPICANLWNLAGHSTQQREFITVMNWSAGKNLHFENETWGQKDVEFRQFEALPQHIPDRSFSLVMRQPPDEAATEAFLRLREQGWHIEDPSKLAADWKSYRHLIQSSMAEFSVAKETYVKSGSGWFSCRSACFLMAGKPVITQDTGWSKTYPAGTGLLAFANLEQAIGAVHAVLDQPALHARRAREIGMEYFHSDRVLSDLLTKAGCL